VPLPRPLLVGPQRVTARSYLLVRVRTESGLEGVGLAFARGLPLARIVAESISPLLLGQDASLPEQVRTTLTGALWQTSDAGLVASALSAVDLALWDLLGRRAQLPVADLLGRRRRTVPVCLVGGYAVEGGEGLDALGEQMADLAARGPAAIKITIGAGTPEEDRARVAVVREAIGDDIALGVDAFRSFAGLDDAVARVRLLEPLGLAYVEDPFPEVLAPLGRELSARTGLPIALGETLSGHRAYRGLLEAGVQVPRIDATVVGGIGEFVRAAALASAYGREVCTHVHPEVHVHLGAAIGNLHRAGLEVMLPELGLDALHRLLERPLELRGGEAVVPDAPGLGLRPDWEAVEAHTVDGDTRRTGG
jgi:L-alanine-DL-glutamate epimerase-like enolase superfamily enzyme